MHRLVEPEWLDELSPGDPRAQASRRDLRQLNAWMGNARTMARALAAVLPQPARRLVELGAGDGHFLCRVVRLLPSHWEGGSAVLLERLAVVSPQISRKFAAMGWQAETVTADVFDWLNRQRVQAGEALVANLFLHHFPAAQLAELLGSAARRAQAFVAVEPRRSTRAMTFSRLVGVIGCNSVTRHDAPISVRAGFTGRELSQLWPANGEWTLEERPAGWFSHLFVARRIVPSPLVA